MGKSQAQFCNRRSELEYRRKWLYQLQSEFGKMCSWYRVSLRGPAFRISDGQATLGAWNPDSRTISISAALIRGYSWDSVLSILKHEMAHQYVHEVLGRGMEPPHGPAFMEACEKFGVQYPFNTATGDTPRVFTAAGQHAEDKEYDKQVNKVRKMLSLAASANKHEAAAAMSKANSFIRKYNLERLDKVQATGYSYQIINTKKKRLHAIERRIASLLLDFFYIDIVYSELFDPERLEFYKTIELLGAMENVAIASHVYDFLMTRVESLWRNYRKEVHAPGKLRKTYILGILQGFREKLAKQEKKETVSEKLADGMGRHKTISGLVVARDPGLSAFIAKRFPRLRKVQYRASSIRCSQTYAAGKHEGKKITIHKAVKHEDGNRGRLLGN